METKITLNNIRSYTKEATLKTDKKINLIYGFNGSGKTTLSDYLGASEEKSEFKDCEHKIPEGTKVLVYNQRYIEKNFRSKAEQKQEGIITLGKENVDAKKKIEDKRKRNEELKEKLGTEEKPGLSQQRDNLENKITKAKDEIQKKVWESKLATEKHDNLKPFLEGFKGSMESYYGEVSKNIDQAKETEDTIHTLGGELSRLSTGENVTELTPPKVSAIETEDIFEKQIVGNENSSVAGLIKELGNSDWVKKGLSYVKEGDEKCPFCQEETLGTTLVAEIKNYFDETYERDINTLNRLKEKYDSFCTSITDLKKKCKDACETLGAAELSEAFSEVRDVLRGNQREIENKQRDPSQTVTLTSSQEKIESLQSVIEEVNEKIKEHNEKIKRQADEEKKIKVRYWNVVRWKHKDVIDAYKKKIDELDEKKKNITTQVDSIQKEIAGNEKRIKELKDNLSNITEVIGKINTRLKAFGLTSFSIEKSGEKSYKIVRGDGENTEDVFRTLSEGEKMIISFFYFLEQCLAHTEKEKVMVVIDDPMTSLSQMYVLHIASIIRKEIFRGAFHQVFVLTHSLYFFHELAYGEKKLKCFRIIKDEKSEIKDMEKDEIQNEYQQYWAFVRDNNSILLANAMRNILEYFFGFMQAEKLADVLEKIKLENKDGFIRFIHKESHSDAINQCSDKNCEYEKYKQAFEKVFKLMGYEDHYNMMMKKRR